MHRLKLQRPVLLALAALVASCASERTSGPRISEADAHSIIEQALPATVPDKPGWADDIYGAFTAQQIEPTKENVCAVVAVIAQESNFQVNSAVPGMARIAWQEIHNRADHTLIPWMVVKAAATVLLEVPYVISAWLDPMKIV